MYIIFTKVESDLYTLNSSSTAKSVKAVIGVTRFTCMLTSNFKTIKNQYSHIQSNKFLPGLINYVYDSLSIIGYVYVALYCQTELNFSAQLIPCFHFRIYL